MNELKSRVERKAFELGLSDIRFAGAGGFTAPKGALPDARSLIVLFMAYRPGALPPAGRMPLSPYYAASHTAYQAARALAGFIQSLGAAAVHAPCLPAKAAALQTGGFIGDNGFYYHPRFGSLVCIQTLLTGAELPLSEAEQGGGCLHCGACSQSCPPGSSRTGGLCLRRHLNGPVPEPLRGGVYQLLGCERCQTACPLNRIPPEQPLSFPLESLLDGSAMPELKQLAGSNMARPMRVKSQAALYAAATGERRLIPQLKALARSGAEPAAAHAAWACAQLESEAQP